MVWLQCCNRLMTGFVWWRALIILNSAIMLAQGLYRNKRIYFITNWEYYISSNSPFNDVWHDIFLFSFHALRWWFPTIPQTHSMALTTPHSALVFTWRLRLNEFINFSQIWYSDRLSHYISSDLQHHTLLWSFYGFRHWFLTIPLALFILIMNSWFPVYTHV
jgi:hypothetical protein